MRRHVRHLAALFISLVLPLGLLAYTSPGKPSGFINDFAGMLKPETVSTLESRLTQFEKQSGAEVTVVTIPTHGKDETIESYAVKLFEEWGIGKKNEDNGLLLLIARDDREMRIEVGYGLEPVITDIESGRIIREVIEPAFKSGEYDRGVSDALDRITSDITNGAPPAQARSVDFSRISNLFYPIVFFIIMLGSILGRSKSWWAGGVLGGIAGIILSFFLGLFYTGLIAIVVLVPLGLLFDYIVSKRFDRYKNGGGPKPPWFIGGGGFGGGGGGFGGFGGGSSGGGGASGRW